MVESSSKGGNRFKALLRAGKPSFGLIATIPSVQSVQVRANAGADWLVIDMERSPIDLPSARFLQEVRR